MSARRRPVTAALTLLFTALLSALAWSEPRPPHSFRVEVIGRGRPLILIPGLASSGDTWKTMVARYRDRYECHVLTLDGLRRRSPSVKYMVTGPGDLATISRWGAASDRRTVADALADVYGLDLREDVARIQTPALALGIWKGVHDEVLESGQVRDHPADVHAEFRGAIREAGCTALRLVRRGTALHHVRRSVMVLRIGRRVCSRSRRSGEGARS